MSKSEQQIYSLIEQLFDAKLVPLKEDISDIKKALDGNGKPGITERVINLEMTQKNLAGKLWLISTFFGFIITAIFEGLRRVFFRNLGI